MNPELAAILTKTVDYFFGALSMLIIVRILMSWLAPHARGRLAYFVFSVTEPILGFFRRLPLRIGMIDLSPIAAILAIDFAQEIALRLLAGLL